MRPDYGLNRSQPDRQKQVTDERWFEAWPVQQRSAGEPEQSGRRHSLKSLAMSSDRLQPMPSCGSLEVHSSLLLQQPELSREHSKMQPPTKIRSNGTKICQKDQLILSIKSIQSDPFKMTLATLR